VRSAEDAGWSVRPTGALAEPAENDCDRLKSRCDCHDDAGSEKPVLDRDGRFHDAYRHIISHADSSRMMRMIWANSQCSDSCNSFLQQHETDQGNAPDRRRTHAICHTHAPSRAIHHEKSRRGGEAAAALFAEGSSTNIGRCCRRSNRNGRPSRAAVFKIDHRDERRNVLGRPGSDLLFQTLRFSTIGAGEFYGRVRDGIGYRPPARTTRPAKDV
jgi:hypothetical protein